MVFDCLHYSGRFVRNGRKEAVGHVENGRADGERAPGDARTRADAVQTLPVVHAQRGHRGQVFGASNVSMSV